MFSHSILNIIEPQTVKQNTHFIEAVSAKMKLLITIGYLVTGDCYRDFRDNGIGYFNCICVVFMFGIQLLRE